MDQGKPAKKRDNGQRVGDRKILEGDMVVTAVGGHFAIGQITAGGDTQSIGSQPKLAEAFERACALAGANHRVFLYPSAGIPDYRPVDCAEVIKSRPTRGKW